MIRVRGFIAFAAALLASSAFSAEREVPISLNWISEESEDLGFDSDALHDLVGAYVEDVGKGRLPGVDLLIARHGVPLLKAALGYANVEDGIAMRFDDLFRLYSMTKPVASVLSLQQIEAGLYELDTPVGAFLPEFSSPRVLAGEQLTRPALHTMTVRHLLTHTAGFSAVWNEDALARLYAERGVIEYQPQDYANTPSSLAEFYQRVQDLPLLHQPGTRRTYGISNDVQGVLVERAAQSRLVEVLTRQLLAPLAMRDTGFCVAHGDLHRLTALYSFSESGALVQDEGGQDSAYACPVPVVSLSGGLVGTISDYWRFAEMLRRGGELDGERVLSQQSVTLLAEPQPGIDEGESWIAGAEWGLGLAIVVAPEKSIRAEAAGNFYWSGSASTSFWVDPMNDLVALIFTQVSGDHKDFSIQTDFRNRVYSAFRAAEVGDKRL